MAAWRAEGAHAREGGRGFVLTEVLVAMVVLLVGLLATAGVLRLAVVETRWVSRAEAARWSVAALADSVLAEAAPSSGERDDAWGRLVWGPDGAGVLIQAFAGDEGAGGRTLARLWVPVVVAGAAP